MEIGTHTSHIFFEVFCDVLKSLMTVCHYYVCDKSVSVLAGISIAGDVASIKSLEFVVEIL